MLYFIVSFLYCSLVISAEYDDIYNNKHTDKYEVVIEVNGNLKAPTSSIRRIDLFKQLKSKIESSIMEDRAKLREISKDEGLREIPEDEDGNHKENSNEPRNNETKRIEMIQNAIIKQDKENIKESKSNDRGILQTLYKHVNSPLLSLNPNKSSLTEQDKQIVDSKGRKVEVLEYTDDMLRIGTDKNMFLTIINNLESMKLIENKTSAGPIEGVVIYKNKESGKVVDFWHKLVFEEKDGIYTDTTGFYKGVYQDTWESLVKNSRLGIHGFFIDSNQQADVEELMIYRSKKLIVDIAYFRKMKVSELMAKNKPFELLEDVIIYNLYPLRPSDIVDVCVCAKSNCKMPCTEIQRIERRNFL